VCGQEVVDGAIALVAKRRSDQVDGLAELTEGGRVLVESGLRSEWISTNGTKGFSADLRRHEEGGGGGKGRWKLSETTKKARKTGWTVGNGQQSSPCTSSLSTSFVELFGAP
jgi:hypothetical protein